MARSVGKDILHLVRIVDSMSNGQVTIDDFVEEENILFVTLVPRDGLYGNGKFRFKVHIPPNYPFAGPEVACLTPIYHPNIENLLVFGEQHGGICVNLLDEWQSTFGLDHVIQALLFLFHQPNLEEPFSPMFTPNMDVVSYAKNVKLSLEGGVVEGIDFPRNLHHCNDFPVNNDATNQQQTKLDAEIMSSEAGEMHHRCDEVRHLNSG